MSLSNDIPCEDIHYYTTKEDKTFPHGGHALEVTGYDQQIVTEKKSNQPIAKIHTHIKRQSG